MADDFEALAASIRRVYPESRIEAVTEEQLAAVRREHPDAPAHYTEFLRRVGWGSLGGSNFILYSGLVGPAHIFDPATAAELAGLAILGDDFSGCVVGFDTRAGWRLVSFDNTRHLSRWSSGRLRSSSPNGLRTPKTPNQALHLTRRACRFLGSHCSPRPPGR